MMRSRRMMMLFLLSVVFLSSSYSMKYDWTEESFRLGVSATGLNISILDYYEGHDTNQAETLYVSPLNFNFEVMFRISVTPYLSIGADCNFVPELHKSSDLKLSTSLTVYRLYPSLAIEMHTKSAYFTDDPRRVRPDTPSIRFGCSLLLGLSPGFANGQVSAFPFIGIKPAFVVSVENVELVLSASGNVLWGYMHKSPYKVIMYDFNILLAVAWRF